MGAERVRGGRESARQEDAAVETSTLEARYRPGREREGIAVCLSGGGFRAALFHAGALRRLNELGILSRVRTVSSVSGGANGGGLRARARPRLARDRPRLP